MTINKDILDQLMEEMGHPMEGENLPILAKGVKVAKKIVKKEKSKDNISIKGFVNQYYKNSEKMFKEKALKLFNENQVVELLKLKEQRLKVVTKTVEINKKERNVLKSNAERFAKENFNTLFKFKEERLLIKIKSPLDNKMYKVTFQLNKFR